MGPASPPRRMRWQSGFPEVVTAEAIPWSETPRKVCERMAALMALMGALRSPLMVFLNPSGHQISDNCCLFFLLFNYLPQLFTIKNFNKLNIFEVSIACLMSNNFINLNTGFCDWFYHLISRLFEFFNFYFFFILNFF